MAHYAKYNVVHWVLFVFTKFFAFSMFSFFTDSDFKSILNLPVTFAPDESEKRVTTQTSADSVLEGTEQFSAVLFSPPDWVTITQDTADISIQETRNSSVGVYNCIFHSHIILFCVFLILIQGLF